MRDFKVRPFGCFPVPSPKCCHSIDHIGAKWSYSSVVFRKGTWELFPEKGHDTQWYLLSKQSESLRTPAKSSRCTSMYQMLRKAWEEQGVSGIALKHLFLTPGGANPQLASSYGHWCNTCSDLGLGFTHIACKKAIKSSNQMKSSLSAALHQFAWWTWSSR